MTIRRRADRSRRDLLQLALVAAPVAVLVGAAWQKRFITDDGFIYFRIVDHVLAGNGPVFNAAQRVETFTSPVWLLLLVIGGALFGWTASLGQIAVVLGTVCSGAAMWFAVAGATRLGEAIDAASGRTPDPAARRPWLLPAGALVVVGFTPSWYWSTSGLDSSLFLCWIAGSFLVIATTARRGAVPSTPWRARAAAMVVGSGWLVRPDAAVFTIAFLVVLLVHQPGRSARARLLAWGLAPSAAYQVFRMGYYASLVPNTALAKQADEAAWARGLKYLRDTTATNQLWPVLALAALLLAVQLLPLLRAATDDGPGTTRRHVAMAAAAPVAAGLLHGTWAVRVGGDYLPGRFLLPALFGVALPCAVVPLRAVDLTGTRLRAIGRGVVPATAVASIAIGLWAGAHLVSAGAWRADTLDQKPEYLFFASSTNPTEISDFPLEASLGLQAAARAERGDDVLLNSTAGADSEEPSTPGSGTFVYLAGVGVAGEAAGIDVWVIDPVGLGDTIAARLPPSIIQRAGHQKLLPFSLAEARFSGAPDLRANTLAARRALRCGELAELLDATEEPLTVGRFLQNIVAAPHLTTLRIPEDGFAMEAQFC